MHENVPNWLKIIQSLKKLPSNECVPTPHDEAKCNVNYVIDVKLFEGWWWWWWIGSLGAMSGQVVVITV